MGDPDVKNNVPTTMPDVPLYLPDKRDILSSGKLACAVHMCN